MRRRDLLIAAGVLAAPLSAPAAASPGAPDLVIFDARYDAARRFAQALAARGAATVEAQADVARLWYGPLRLHRAGGGRIRIAGLTTWADFAVIQSCAREARLRPRHVVFHDRSGRSHRVARGSPDLKARLEDAGRGWPESLAATLGGLDRPSPPASGSPRLGALVSWVLA